MKKSLLEDSLTWWSILKMISNFNLLKNNINVNHGKLLSNIIQSVDKQVCFIGDESTYFFSQVRRINNPSISFTNKNIFNFFMFFNNSDKVKFYFENYHKAFDYALIEHFEKKVFNVDDVILRSYMLFCLLNLSDNTDDALSNYNELNVELLDKKISNIKKYFLNDTKILFEEYPRDNFIISYDKDFSGEGVLITKRHIDGNLMQTVDNFNYYYRAEL